MSTLCLCSPAKINLYLEVLGLRDDGFHELAMVMQTIDLVDELSMRPSDDEHFHLEVDRTDVPVDSSNLVLRAAESLRSAFPKQSHGVHFHLTKRIPVGAGLAGGSGNAAATLVGLNVLWDLGLSYKQLEPFAATIGSDVPFCLGGGTQFCFGRGEQLEPLPPLQDGAVLLVTDPRVSVSTTWAYTLCREHLSHRYLSGEVAFSQRRMALRQGPMGCALAEQNMTAIGKSLRNDIEELVRPRVKAVADARSLLSGAPGNCGVQMSGSGPSLFALFNSIKQAISAQASIQPSLMKLGMDSYVCGFHPDGIRQL